jgi:hypothetical protein
LFGEELSELGQTAAAAAPGAGANDQLTFVLNTVEQVSLQGLVADCSAVADQHGYHPRRANLNHH